MTQTAHNKYPHSLAAILSPSTASEDPGGVSPAASPKRTHTEAFAVGAQRNQSTASPTQQRASICTATSPGTRGADDEAGRAMKGGQEEKKPQRMVRSLIACARCRRSKIKCVNEGTHSTCKACATSGRDCQYPAPAAVPTSNSRRSETTANNKQEEGESKKRVRKIEDTGRRNSARIEDALEASVLTRKVWDEVYDIFKLHFSTEIPFLHPPTFRNRMRQASYPRDHSVASTDLQDGKVLLLGVLTLTARFHPDLVAYHSQSAKASKPSDASEYYATALKKAFAPTGITLTSPSIDGIQALLMLGLYEWGQTRGLSAWVYIGIAMRLAQSMGLAYEDDDNNRTFKPSPLRNQVANVRENAIEKEVRRRTLWSCFIMDRMLSAGKYRPTMISVGQLKVQLPCSDDQFLFVRDVATGFLDKPADKNINDDGVLSWYIRLVEIFGRFSEWSYAGGRRTETLPPWDSSTRFYKLRRELETFQKALPSNMTFTEANLSAHIEKRNATTYASMHTLYSLCLIMLHREYIPFIPLRCERPSGPLDAPVFPKDQYQVPDGFWEESAEAIFKAAKDLVDIVRTCQDNNALPESPQIGFAVWQAAFVCVYAVHFPHMDVGEHLTAGASQANDDYRTRGYAGLTVKILGEMVPKLGMARGYVKLIGKMHDYFANVRREYQERFRQSWSGVGGLEQYKTLETELKEFGSLQDADRQLASDGSDTVDQARSRASTNDIGHGSLNGEAMQGVEEGPTPRPWAAINSTSPANENEERKYNPNQVYQQYNPNYQQSPAQNSNPPSLVSPGETTPGLNSPYTSTQPHPSSGQQQHIPAYAPIGHHPLPMGPPGAHTEMRQWTNEANNAWILRQEGINASAYCDNMAQIEFSEGQFEPVLGYMQSLDDQNYRHVLGTWASPSLTGFEQRGYY